MVDAAMRARRMKLSTRVWIMTLLAAALLGALALPVLPAHAAPAVDAYVVPAPGWTQPYASLAEQPLRSVLQTFADDHALQLVVAADFKSKVDHAPSVGPLRADSAAGFLKQLSARYPFNWFVYESRLYISSAQDYHTERIGPLEGGLDQAHQALVAIGLLDSRFGWGELQDQSSVLISGPAHYLELMRQMLRIAKPASPEQILMRFPLRYAPVDDRKVQGCGSTSVIPGVASLLTKLMTGTTPPFSGSTSLPLLPGGTGAGTGAAAMGAGGYSYPSTYPQGMMGMNNEMGNPPLSNLLGGTPMNLAAAMQPMPSPMQQQPRPASNLVADVRGNAILVRDAASRRGYYQSLLDTLDVPAPVVAIDMFSIEFNPSVQPLLDHLAAVACMDGHCTTNDSGGDKQLEFVSQLTQLVASGKIEMVSRQRLITEDNQLVALTLDRHFASSGNGPAPADDAGSDAGGDGGQDGGRNTGDQFCIKPHQIGGGAEPLIELMLSTSLHEPIGGLGETPESYTQRHLNTVLTLRSGTPMLVETDTLVPKMARQRALLLLVQPSQVGNAP